MALGIQRVADIERQIIMASAYGNVAVKSTSIILPATTADDDTIDFMELPVGVRIIDCLARLTPAAAGTVTFALGIAQKPGHLDTKVDPDALILAAAISTSATIRRRNNVAVGHVGLTLDDTYLIQGIIEAAALGATPVTVELDVIYEYLGTT
jgi:hypothetical protein